MTIGTINYSIEDVELQNGDLAVYQYEIDYIAESYDYGVDHSPVLKDIELIEGSIYGEDEAVEYLKTPAIWKEHKETILNQCMEAELCQ